MLGTVGVLAILLALSIVAVRVLLIQVPERRAELQAWVNQATGLDLRLGELTARWGISGPEIYAANVEVYAPDGGPRLARAEGVSIATDLKRMLMRTERFSGRVRLIGPEVRLVRTAGGLELEGRPQFTARKDGAPMNSDALPSIALEIVDGRITVLDARTQADEEESASAAVPEEVLRLQGLNLKLQRERGAVRFAGNLDLPRRMGGQLQFNGSANGRLDDPHNLDWALTLAGRQLQLDPWGEFFTGRWQGLNPQGEVENLSISFAGRGAGAPKFEVTARFTGVGIDAVDRVPGLRGLAGEIHGTDAAGEVCLHAADFQLDMPYRFREPLMADSVAGNFEWKRARVTPVAEPADSPALDLADNLADPVVSAALTDVANVANVAMVAEDSSPPQQQTAEVDAWMIVGHEVQLRSAHGSADLELELTIPRDDSSRVLELHGTFRDALVQETRRYVPVDRLRNPKTVAWLDQAFRAGRVVSGEVKVSGPTRRFPFRNGEGEFQVDCSVEDVTLNYGDGWPQLKKLTADVQFRNQGMSGTLRSGEVQGMQIMPGATARIPDFREAEVTASGQARGDLDQALVFLQSSPLREKLGETFARLRGSGPIDTQLELFLPIKRMAARKVSVVAELGAGSGRDRLRLDGTAHEILGLRGRLQVQDTQLIAEGLRGTYLGGPATIDFRPETDQHSGLVRNVAHISASTPTAALTKVLPLPPKVDLAGTVSWQAVARMTPGAGTDTDDDAMPRRPSFTVQVDSDLQGVAIGLPAPLGKTAQTSRPLRLQVQWPQPDATELRISYGSLLRANLGFLRGYPHQARAANQPASAAAVEQAATWRFSRGAVSLGGGLPRLPDEPGMRVDGAVDELDLSGWLGMRSGKSGGRPLSDYLRSVNLSVQDLGFYGFHLPEVTASLVSGAQAWSVSVDGPRSRGMVLVPFELDSPQPLIVNMTLLDLGEIQPGPPRARDADPDPRRWPPVKISIREFSAWNKHFGLLRAELARASDGLVLESLSAQGPGFGLSGSGMWTVGGAGQEGTLQLQLDSTDVLQTLQQLGYGGSLAGKRGSATLDLHWPGVPDGQLLGRLTGTMHVEVDDGQLIAVQPGAGRVFGLMSVATLRRRLSLDFSDLTDKGLAFDEIRGDFTLRGGDAYTSNLLLRGPAAEIGVVGRTGLEARDYDQTAVVTGNFGQSLPMAGALAGGPAVGAALLVFSQIFKQPLKGVARGYYRITGPWDDPAVERVQAEDLKKAEGAAKVMEEQAGAS